MPLPIRFLHHLLTGAAQQYNRNFQGIPPTTTNKKRKENKSKQTNNQQQAMRFPTTLFHFAKTWWHLAKFRFFGSQKFDGTEQNVQSECI